MRDREKILASLQQATFGVDDKASEKKSGERGQGQAFRREGDNPFSWEGENLPVEDLLHQAEQMIRSVGGEVLKKDSEAYTHWVMPENALRIRGEFLVAENGAVWFEPGESLERSAIFLVEHLVIEVPSQEIVATMHEAYARLNDRKISYGTFISGPSKTADIEQSLVIGAQGPKSCWIILI